MNSRVTRPGGLGPSTVYSTQVLRVATYNIHKGVRGMGPRKRLEIHNLGLGIEALDADLVFLQEVRLFHAREARHFDQTHLGWPEGGQAEFLAPQGYESAYRTTALRDALEAGTKQGHIHVPVLDGDATGEPLPGMRADIVAQAVALVAAAATS